MPDTILTTCGSYRKEVISPFIESLKKTGWKGQLVVFTNNLDNDTTSYLRENRATLFPFSTSFPFIPHLKDPPKNQLSVNCIRYYLYEDWIKREKPQGKILLTDMRDVIFQKDPFDFPYPQGLSCFLEDKRVTLATCPYNSRWMREAFGENTLKDIGHFPVSCSGVTVGDAQTVEAYLKAMVSLLKNHGGKGGIDQAVHNYLLRTNNFQVTYFENEKGPVATLATFLAKGGVLRFGKDGTLKNADASIINIVHQYERNKDIKKLVGERIAQEKNQPLNFFKREGL